MPPTPRVGSEWPGARHAAAPFLLEYPTAMSAEVDAMDGLIKTCLVLVAGAGGMAVQRALDAPEPSFAQALNRPLRIAVDAPAATSEQLLASVARHGGPDLVVSEMASADVVVHLLQEWRELPTAPSGSPLASLYDRARSLTDATVQFSMTVPDASGDRRLVVFDTDHYPGWGIDCFGWMLAHDLTGVEGESFLPPASCPI